MHCHLMIETDWSICGLIDNRLVVIHATHVIELKEQLSQAGLELWPLLYAQIRTNVERFDSTL